QRVAAVEVDVIGRAGDGCRVGASVHRGKRIAVTLRRQSCKCLKTGGRVLTNQFLPAEQSDRTGVRRHAFKDEDVVAILRVSWGPRAVVVKALKGSESRERIREPPATGSECQCRARRSAVVDEPDHAADGDGYGTGSGFAGGVRDGVSERV